MHGYTHPYPGVPGFDFLCNLSPLCWFHFGIAHTIPSSVASGKIENQVLSVALSFWRSRLVNHLRTPNKIFSLSVGLRISTGSNVAFTGRVDLRVLRRNVESF